MGEIIDVKSIVEKKKNEIKEKIKTLSEKNITPKLAIILANEEEASKIYVGKKRKLCEELGIEQLEYVLNKDTTTEEILEIIYKLNSDEKVDGILVQLPLFKHLDETKILNNILPEKDVDGFHPLNLGKLIAGQESTIACTPKGIIMILEAIGTDFVGKDAVVVGRSVIVGKPISQLLLNKGATVTTCHSKTKDLSFYTKNADILVVATGVPHLIKKDMVKVGSTVVDVGINRIDGKIIGDVDTEEVLKVAKYITPVPGGVGLTTVVSLIDSVVNIASKRVK